MPSTNLTPKSVHVDAPLTNVAIKFKNMALVAERVFPVVPVAKESDKYYIFRKEELIIEKARRAAGAEAKEITWDVDTATYSAEEYALKHLVADRIVNNADNAVRPKITSTQKLTNKLLLAQEKRIADLVQDTTYITNNGAPTTQWDQSSPNIEGDVDAAKNSVRTQAGTESTSIVIPYKVAQIVKRDTTVRNLIRYTVPGDVLLRNGDLPPVLWNLEVIVAGAIRNTANEAATEVLSDVWTDNVLVFYKEATPSLDALSLGYIFRVGNFVTKTYRVEERAGDMIEVSVVEDEKLVAAACGYLLTNVASAF